MFKRCLISQILNCLHCCHLWVVVTIFLFSFFFLFLPMWRYWWCMLTFFIYMYIYSSLSLFLNFFEILPKSSLIYHFYWATFQENENFYSQCHSKSGFDDEKCFFSTGTSIDGRQGWQILYFGMCTQFSLSI